MDYVYTGNKYYSSSENQYSSEDSASYTTESKYRSCSPLLLEQVPTHNRYEFHIPTRQQFITTSKAAYNPLQFITQQRSAAVELSEQARQQIEVVEQQKRILEGIANRMPRQYTYDDDEASWQSNLDAWLSKRKAVTSHKIVDSDTAKQMQQRVPLKSVPELRIKDKEEILTVSSSSPLDEHTDSGIENNRSNSNLQSPSTSLDFSPRSDSRQSGYQSGSFSPRYFIRATSPLTVAAVPLTAPPPLPSALETVNVLQKSVELEDAIALPPSGTLLQIDINKDPRRNKASKIDQAVVGYGFTKKSYGSDYSSIGGRTPCSDSENEFASPLSAESPKDDLEILKSDRATPLDSRVDSALPEQDYDSTLSESNSGTLEALEHLTVQSPSRTQLDNSNQALLNFNDRNEPNSKKAIKGISLGVELQREQSANITAVKFPVKKQNYAAEKTFRAHCSSLSATEPSDTEISSSPAVSIAENKLLPEAHLEPVKAGGNKEAESTMKTSTSLFDNKSSNLKSAVEAPTEPKSKSDGIITMNIDLGYQNKNSRKYFGFVVGGGKDKDILPFVENVIPGTPAEDAGLKIGDIILSINGELVEGRYHQTIMRMLREAGVLGEVELQVVRPGNNSAPKPGSLPYTNGKSNANSFQTFDEKRAKFDEKAAESSTIYNHQVKSSRNISKWSIQRETREKPKQINTPPPTLPKTVSLHRSKESSVPAVQTQCSAEVRQAPAVIASTSTIRSSSDSDYRVTSFDEKPGPGKLADFIPEVERGKVNSGMRAKSVANDDTSLRRENDIEEPKVLRNFDVSPTKSVPIKVVPTTATNKKESERNETGNSPKAQMDSKEWRHYIEEQRYPSGAKSTAETNKRFSGITNSRASPNEEVDSTSAKRLQSQYRLPPIGITEATRLSKGKMSLSAGNANVENQPKSYYYSQTHTQQSKRTSFHNGDLISLPPVNSREQKGSFGWNDENLTQQVPILSISGKHRCSHCQMELGRGAAMIIESLNLFYHLGCFRCYVCNAALGNGAQGADVRVRDSKLHCQNCYHNEKDGLKYSQV